MLGVEVRFAAPVFVGDAVALAMRVLKVVPKTGNRSVVSFQVDVVGSDGKPRAHVTQHYLLRTSLAEAAP
jgi:acyl dehydratase